MKKYLYLIIIVLLAGCTNSKSIVGTWYYVADYSVMTMTFNSDGTCSTKEESGEWSNEDKCIYEIKDDKLFVTIDKEASQGVSYEITDEYLDVMGIKFFKDIEKAREYDNKNKVTVPDVTGMTIVEAQELLIKNKLEIGMIIEDDSENNNGLVTRTRPASGEKVSKFTEVTIYHSKVQSYVYIEDYTGRDYHTVRAMLEEYGINVTIEYKESNISTDLYAIVDQSVKPGEKLNEGDKITLYVRT